MLQHHIDFLEFWVVDDFEETDDVGVPDLLQDSNLSLSLALGIKRHLPKPTLLGKALYDLDSDVIARLKTPSQLDLAMSTSADFVDNLVLVYQLPSGDEVLFDLCLVGSGSHMLVSN